jgi:uncharacterized protein
MSEATRVVPFADRDSAPWWAAVARHEFVQQRCDSCGTWRWPPRVLCGHCGSQQWSWQPVLHSGRVVSWITTHHAFLPGFEAPYHTVFVRLDLSEGSSQDDIVMPGSWFGDEAPFTGMAVVVHCDDIDVPEGDPVALVGWKPLEQ